MDPSVKDVPESMKLVGPTNYVIWAYKVRMILMQESLWRFVEPSSTGDNTPSASSSSGTSSAATNPGTPDPDSADTTTPSLNTMPAVTNNNLARDTELRYRAGRIIVSTVRDSILLSIIHLTNPQAIWLRLRSMCDVRSSSRRLALKEQFYSLKLAEGKGIADHLQEINLLVTQLANLGIAILDEDLVDLTLNSLPKSWSTFRQIQKGRERTPLFSELEGLLLQEELGRTLERRRDEAEEVNFVRTERGPSRGGRHFRGRSTYGRGTPNTHGVRPPPANFRNDAQDRRLVKCHKCGKQGHYARECEHATLEEQIRTMQIQLSNIKRYRRNQQQHVHLAETQDEGTDHSAESDATHLQACINAFDDKSDAPEAVVNACITGGIEEEWFLDSGASSHVTGNPHLLSDISHSRIPSIRIVGGISMHVAHQGTVSTINSSGKIKHINQVLYVPGVRTNLFSVGKLTDAGYRVLFSKHNCLIYDKDNPNCIFLRAIRDSRNNLYRVQERFGATPSKSTEEPLINVTTIITCPDGNSSQHNSRTPLSYEPVPAQENQSDPHLNPEPVISEPTHLPINSTSRFSQTQVWHKRLGHLNYQSLYHLTTKQLVAGIPALSLTKHVCPSCMIGKLPKDRKPKHRTTRTSRPLQLIHSDICGPMPVTSRKGNKYILTFIDDFTRKTWIYFLSENPRPLTSSNSSSPWCS